ncbi:Crp/Fnr family transcriptional regulator [Variovorax sp. AFSI2.2]|uniref:Crp/Fnr family transcriptional regulator n=1 Tax=Variovorax sp. AFSI2.2 TaxID=3384160 RepID=UPI003EC14295
MQHSQEIDNSRAFAAFDNKVGVGMLTDPALMKQMAGNRWFSSLPIEDRNELLQAGQVLRLRPGEILCRRGDPPRAFYGVMGGTLKVSTLCEDGREAVLSFLDAGNWFGEASLLDGSRRSHDVMAVDSSLVLTVPSIAFAGLMQHAAFSTAIALLLAGRVHRLYSAVEDAMLRSMRAQVARRLLHLAQGDVSSIAPTQARSAVQVSHETLAAMLGITRQTVAKELRWLAATGSIHQQYGRIEITSIAKLRETAGAS